MERELHCLRRQCNQCVEENKDSVSLRVLKELEQEIIACDVDRATVIQRLHFDTMEEKIAFAIYFSVINFNFSGCDYSYRYQGQMYYRSTALLYALYNTPILFCNTTEVFRMGEGQWKKNLCCYGEGTLPLFEKRMNRLRKMAAYLTKEQVNFHNFYERFSTLNELFVFFKQSHLYEDVFLKRIQMLLNWLYCIAIENKIGLSDITMLTGLADYRLPQLFYNVGLVRLSPDERKMLLSRMPLREQDAFVRKMRCITIYICDYLAKKTEFTPIEIDCLLWNLSQQKLVRKELPIPAMNIDTMQF